MWDEIVQEAGKGGGEELEGGAVEVTEAEW